jgi:hypothetical protein
MAILGQPVMLNSGDEVDLAFAEHFFADTGDAAQVEIEEKSVGADAEELRRNSPQVGEMSEQEHATGECSESRTNVSGHSRRTYIAF